MYITSIGDIHGRSVWKNIVENNPDSKFIFLGDYPDPYDNEHISEEDSIENLKQIIEFKKSNPSKVTLLIGNHDAQYLYYPNFTLTNDLSSKNLTVLIKLFKDNSRLFKIAVQKNNYLFTHAGISNGWFNEYFRLLTYYGLNETGTNLDVVLNKISRDSTWRRAIGSISHHRGGRDKFGGPLWVDKMELFNGQLIGFHQIVGHNRVNDIVTLGNDETSITFCDCLFNQPDGYTIDI